MNITKKMIVAAILIFTYSIINIAVSDYVSKNGDSSRITDIVTNNPTVLPAHSSIPQPSNVKCTEEACIIPDDQPSSASATASVKSEIKSNPSSGSTITIEEDEGWLHAFLIHENILLILGLFWLLGILLAFTPCTLPLILLVASILGRNSLSMPHKKIVMLSLTYVLTLAITYAVAGIIAVIFGFYLQTYLQSPFIIGGFSMIIAFLALSLLGIYQFKLPAIIHRFAVRHNRVKQEYRHTEVALMGIMGTLIATPCLAAPIVAALGYAGQSGHLLEGGAALFSLGAGVGTPLFVSTAIGIRFLPPKGPWQEALKTLLGLILLGTAIWIFMRIISPAWSMLIWSGYILYAAYYLYLISCRENNTRIKVVWRIISTIILLYSTILFTNFMLGNFNPAKPFKFSPAPAPASAPYQFMTIVNLNHLKVTLANATMSGKKAILFFHANWCEACVKQEKSLLRNRHLHNAINKLLLLKVDLTALSQESRQIMRSFKIVGPPAIFINNLRGEWQYFKSVEDINWEELSN